ncbi:MAG: hypothetical protein Q4F00_05490 [bacterium]|nr:hypothetical protein [bacterium]
MKTTIGAAVLIAVLSCVWVCWRYARAHVLDGPGMVNKFSIDSIIYVEEWTNEGHSVRIEARLKPDDRWHRIELSIREAPGDGGEEKITEYLAKSVLFEEMAAAAVRGNLPAASDRVAPPADKADMAGENVGTDGNNTGTEQKEAKAQLTITASGRPPFTLIRRHMIGREREAFDSIAEKLRDEGFRWWPER